MAETWLALKNSARDDSDPFANVPALPGVYILRVSKMGVGDIEQVKETFLSSHFFKAVKEVDKISGTMFGKLGLGEKNRWTFSDYYQSRMERLDRIALKKNALSCPILYIGKANSLYRRMNELAFYGHTVNAPFWALLLSGWELEVGIKPLKAKSETAEEARLKEVYRGLHDGGLPPLVHR